jgi:uncharacterized protein (TIGR02646 family)
MIRLHKGDEPKVLSDNAAAWTAEIVAAYASGGKPTEAQSTRYRHEDIKSAIVAETHGKCAYCETKVVHSQPGDIEHIFPKSIDRAKTFEWQNLTLACRTCNANKSNKDPNYEHIMDPYKVDPLEHLVFLGPLVASSGSVEGTNTRTILELHRTALTEDRQHVLERHLLVYGEVSRNDLPVVVRKAIYEDFVAREAAAGAEYSAMNRALIAAMESRLPPDILS